MHPLNPFAEDSDRAAIWEMLMPRDFVAFATSDWSMVEGDFLADEFFGVHGNFEHNCDRWTPQFPTLESYRDEWLRQAAASAKTADLEALPEVMLSVADLSQIDIAGSFAVAHKKFDGDMPLADGTRSGHMQWQTLYLCRKTAAGWKIRGFFGYLPNPLPASGG